VNIPNLISLARLMAVPFAVYLILHQAYAAAFWLFVAAGVSDAIDGYLAKRLNQVSALGAYLDPIADKALLVAVYVTLGHEGKLALWLVILVVFRDVVIVGGVLLLHIMRDGVKMKPLMISKVNTTVQIALVAVALAELGLGFKGELLVPTLCYLVAATTLASGAAYVVNWGREEPDIVKGRT
jgi:cardiolipin synthase